MDGLLEMLRPHGVLEMARTGRVAMVRGAGSRTTNGDARDVEASGEAPHIGVGPTFRLR